MERTHSARKTCGWRAASICAGDLNWPRRGEPAAGRALDAELFHNLRAALHVPDSTAGKMPPRPVPDATMRIGLLSASLLTGRNRMHD